MSQHYELTAAGMACISMIQEEIQQDSDLKLWAEHPLLVNRHC